MSSRYQFKTIEELYSAIDLWISDQDSAIKTYGHINTWYVNNRINIISVQNIYELKKKEQIAFQFFINKKFRESEIIYKEIIDQKGLKEISFKNFAFLCGMRGDKLGIEKNIKKALEINPNYFEGYIILGNIYKERNDFKEVILCYEQALKIKPNSYQTLNNLGNIYKSQGFLEQAISSYKKALKIKPGIFTTLINLGEAYTQLAEIKKAIKFLKLAIKQNPQSEFGFFYLANAYKKKNDFNSAILNYKKALSINSNLIEALSNLALTFSEKGEHTKSLSSYQDALKIDPNNKEINKNIGMEYLLLGDFKKGWIKYEYRKIKKQFNPDSKRLTSFDQLNFKEPLLIVSEQGLGDTVQFMRYIPHIMKNGLKIVFAVEEKLHKLIITSKIHPNPINQNSARLFYEHRWLPLLSLPKLLGITEKSPIITKPYISSSKELIQKWKIIFQKEKQPIVGLNWQGNPNVEKDGVKGRSMKLEELSKLSKGNFKFLSLQKGYGSEQLNKCSFRKDFVSFQPTVDETWDFLETLAIIINCDLVITTDTCVAHLSGAVGKKTFLLLHSSSDWRWGYKTDKSFWYPSLYLYRQEFKNSWQEVVERLSCDLEKLF